MIKSAALASMFDSTKRNPTPSSPDASSDGASSGSGSKTAFSHNWVVSKDEAAARLLNLGDRVDIAGYWCPGEGTCVRGHCVHVCAYCAWALMP